MRGDKRGGRLSVGRPCPPLSHTLILTMVQADSITAAAISTTPNAMRQHVCAVNRYASENPDRRLASLKNNDELTIVDRS